MNELRSQTRRAAAAAAAAAAAESSKATADEIDWDSVDFDSLYKQKKEEKAVVDEFGVDLATLERLEQEALAKVANAAAPAAAAAAPLVPQKAPKRMMF